MGSTCSICSNVLDKKIIRDFSVCDTARDLLLTLALLSEYHTGYRAFSKTVLETLPLNENSDDFVFDNEMLAQAIYSGFKIGQISCPTRYFEDASSINFRRSVKYGLGVLATSAKFALQKRRIRKFPLFSAKGKRLLERRER